MVYSMDRIPGTEDVAAQRRIGLLLNNKFKQEYSEICGCVRARVSLAIVSSNTLLLNGARDQGVYICQRPDLADWAVMALLASWRG